jgi:hypothetical protein
MSHLKKKKRHNYCSASGALATRLVVLLVLKSQSCFLIQYDRGMGGAVVVVRGLQALVDRVKGKGEGEEIPHSYT